MIINKYNYEPLSRESIDGKRHYCLPDGSKVPSVTTILDKTKSVEKMESLQKWKDQMGEERARQITTEAANRGTRMHSYLETYILAGDMKPLPTNPYAHPSWFMAAEVILNGLPNITEFWGVEVPLYYSGLYAGTTDLIGEWKGRPAIMDFKQSNKPKKREWIEDYFLQLAAYAAAHNEMHGTTIDCGVVLMCVQPEKLENGEFGKPQYLEFEVEPKEFAYWSEKWMKRVELYYLTK